MRGNIPVTALELIPRLLDRDSSKEGETNDGQDIGCCETQVWIR